MPREVRLGDSLDESQSVLVTGGAGFIGSHLVEQLVSKGHKVTVLDNFSSRQPHVREAEINLLKGDICDPKTAIVATRAMDMVYHLAAVLGVEYAYQHPLDTLEVEVRGTRNILEGSRMNNVKRIIYGSSSEIYGEPLSLPVREIDQPAPKSTYAVAKLAGERYCEAYQRAYGIDFVILRYFNVYGPRQDDRFVIPRFIRAALRNAPLLLYGDGNQVRDFTFVKDAVQLTLAAAQADKAKCQTFNVATGVATKAYDLARLVVSLVCSNSQIALKDFDQIIRPREIEVFNRIADVSKSREMLSYDAQTSIRDGISATISWMRESLRQQ